MQTKKWQGKSSHGNRRNSKTVKRDYIANLYANTFEDLDEMHDFLGEYSLLV